jgi:uncharacterized lipoprotein YehR (DUF1307 family)
MKKRLLLCLCVAFGLPATAQTNDCNGYFAYKAGTKMDITLYDKKDKVFEYLAKGVGIVKSESFDAKGKKISSQMLTKLQR